MGSCFLHYVIYSSFFFVLSKIKPLKLVGIVYTVIIIYRTYSVAAPWHSADI